MSLMALPLNDRMLELVARRFRLLGEPYRLRILQALQAGEKSVSEIVEALDGNQPNISKHLQALYEAGLLARRRQGNSILYGIADPTIFRLCDLVCRSATERERERLQELLPTPNRRPRRAH